MAWNENKKDMHAKALLWQELLMLLLLLLPVNWIIADVANAWTWTTREPSTHRVLGIVCGIQLFKNDRSRTADARCYPRQFIQISLAERQRGAVAGYLPACLVHRRVRAVAAAIDLAPTYTRQKEVYTNKKRVDQGGKIAFYSRESSVRVYVIKKSI